MNIVQKIAKNTLALFIAQFAGTLLSMLLIILIARNLGDEMLGRYSFAIAFSMFFSFFSSFGYNTLIIREIARDESITDNYVGNILLGRMVLNLILFFLIVAVINVIGYPSYTKNIVYLFGLHMLTLSLSNVFKFTFRAFEKMEYDAGITIIGTVLRCIVGIILIELGYGLIALGFVFLASSLFDLILSTIVFEKICKKTKLIFNVTFWKSTIPVALSLGMLSLFGMIFDRSDTIMLSIMKGDAVVGWYNAAYNLISVFRTIPLLLTSAILPMMSNLYIQSKESLKNTYKKSFKYLLILGLPSTIGITLLAKKIIFFIYGTDFVNSIFVLQILSWDILLIFLYSTLGALLVSIDRHTQMAYIGGFTALVNVVLNLFLIPSLSYIGSAIATIASEAVLFGLYYYIISKQFYALKIHKVILKPIVSSFLMGIFIMIFLDIHLIILVCLSVLLYFIVLYLIKGFTSEDIWLFKQIFLRKNRENNEF